MKRTRWLVSVVGVGLVAGFFGGPARSGEAEVLASYLEAFPEAKAIGVLYSEARHDGLVVGLEEAAEKKGLKVVVARVPSVKEFPGALQGLKDQVDTVWVVDDEIYSLQETWNYLIMFCLRNKLKTVVSTEKALQFGGLFYCGPDQSCRVNKRILEVLGLTVSERAGSVQYYDGSGP